MQKETELLKEMYLICRKIRTITEDPGTNEHKLDAIHSLSDNAVYEYEMFNANLGR